MNNIHTVILIIGRTGSGKTSLVNKICEQMNYKQLISQTTRPRRNDQDNDHIFVTVEDYLQAKKNGCVIAETEIAGNYYYATKEQLYDADFYVIDPRGRNMLLSMNLPDIRFVSIFINVPDDVRKDRCVNKRGDNRNTYAARNLDERQQFRDFLKDAQFDYSILNNNFPNAYCILKWICNVEGVWKNYMENEK